MRSVTSETPRELSRDGEAGQTMVEYAVALSVITVTILAAVIAIGDAAGGLVENVAAFLT